MAPTTLVNIGEFSQKLHEDQTGNENKESTRRKAKYPNVFNFSAFDRDKGPEKYFCWLRKTTEQAIFVKDN